LVQAFLLPFTKDPAHVSRPSEADSNFWQKSFERLSAGKESWEHFLQIAKSLPAARLALGREGRTLLHLAVLHDDAAAVSELKEEAFLKMKRDAFGLTALDLARFLGRKKCLEIFQAPPDSFSKQPNVAIQGELSENIEYCPHPVFETAKGFDNILIKTKKAKEEDQIPSEKIWMGIHFDKEILKWLHPKVSIRFVDEKLGHGVFAEQRIQSCGFVGEYTGEVQERKTKHLKDKIYCLRYTVWEMGGRNFVIDAERKGNFTRFINHSSQPNLGLQSVYWRGMPRMIFVALKEISPGTQLTFDYGAHFWKEAGQTPQPI